MRCCILPLSATVTLLSACATSSPPVEHSDAGELDDLTEADDDADRDPLETAEGGWWGTPPEEEWTGPTPEEGLPCPPKTVYFLGPCTTRMTTGPEHDPHSRYDNILICPPSDEPKWRRSMCYMDICYPVDGGIFSADSICYAPDELWLWEQRGRPTIYIDRRGSDAEGDLDVDSDSDEESTPGDGSSPEPAKKQHADTAEPALPAWD